ncbi:MAG TPA: V-type ATPase subunit [Candidatus Brocadiia bacterium]|nr:V-type ATPase subunit [Candidatus Brocadiia bacterium]
MAARQDDERRDSQPEDGRKSGAVVLDLPASYVAAKLHARRARIFEYARLRDLASCTSLKELSTRLGADSSLADHVDFESWLMERHVNDFGSIRDILSEGQSQLANILLQRYQIENLKACIRYIINGRDRREMRRHLVPLPEHMEKEIAAALEAQDLETLPWQIANPGLRNALGKGLVLYKKRKQNFFLEAALDSFYYARLIAVGTEKKTTLGELGAKLVYHDVNIYGVLLTLRGCLNYGVTREEILQVAPPPAGPMSNERYRRLSESTNIQQALVFLEPLLKRSRSAAAIQDIQGVESAMWSRLYKLANRAFYSSDEPNDLVPAYFMLKRIEMKNLLRLAELIRYQAREKEILDRFIEMERQD